MKLQKLLNKISNTDFLLTVPGLCDKFDFYYYGDLKKESYQKEYKDPKIEHFAILRTSNFPELFIILV